MVSLADSETVVRFTVKFLGGNERRITRAKRDDRLYLMQNSVL
jgi:hypothetical protein